MCDLRNSKLKQGSYFILEDVDHCKSKHYGCVKSMLDPVLRLNARSAQPMSGPVFSSNSGFVKPSLYQVLG